MNLRTLLLLGASVVASATAIAASAAAQDASSVAVGEVIVTAERRTQSIQKSSLAISVLSPEALAQAGVTQARDLVKLDPGVQIGQGGPATQIYVRGVGDFGSTPLTNPAVATNVDGVYVARSQSIEGNFFDLERIEVLKGPQGTLYGRNSSGGVLNIISRKPTLGSYGGRASLEVGNYKLVNGEAAINVPIGENAAIRASTQFVTRNGYSTSGFDDDKHESFRVSGLWKPNDRFSALLIAQYTHVGGVGPAQVFKGPLQAVTQNLVNARLGNVPYPSDPRADFFDPEYRRIYYAVAVANNNCAPNTRFTLGASANGPVYTPIGSQGLCGPGNSQILTPTEPGVRTVIPHVNNKFSNLTAQFDYDLGFATLTVLPAYREVRNDYVTFPGGVFNSAARRPEKSDMRSFEARLGNSSERLTWVAGLYIFDERQSAITGGVMSYTIRNGNAETYYIFRNQAEALFGQATFSVTDQLRLIGGLRYTKDHRAVDGKILQYSLLGGQPWFPAGNGPNSGLCYLKPDPCTRDVFIGKKDFTATTGKVGLEYDLTERNMLFVTYALGQKAGGFNATSVLGGAPGEASFYRPEKLNALEIGSRNRFLDNALQVNLELFHWTYKDSQQNFNFLSGAGLPTNGYTNAGEAKMYGGDIDVTWRFTPNDVFHAGVEYNHANFGKFVYTGVNVNSAASTCAVSPQTVQPVPGLTFQNVDCSGRQLIRTPRWAGTVGYTHTFFLENGATIDAGINTQFATLRWGGVAYLDAMKLKGYFTQDVNVTYRDPAKWSVGAFVRNLSDELVYTGTDSNPNYAGMVVANISSPRTFGVRLEAQF
ncbi:TonB-dependent receptor [Phenylobacterium immobile]|uniref:TonB-dependent receptor n=1 Tax=Phenylobacterium immobile TaxID=21 RepID=UPI000AECAB70|nr:TonB-dependent receptor [Phenylobacterium immobile]